MLVLVAYDVNTETKEGRKRLRRVARACEDFGQRVQKSVFECVVRQRDWVLLRARLLKEFDASADSLRFYFLDEETRQRTEHHGVGRPIDVEAPLIV
jgi:CRISPR-associated protein Cas2